MREVPGDRAAGVQPLLDVLRPPTAGRAASSGSAGGGGLGAVEEVDEAAQQPGTLERERLPQNLLDGAGHLEVEPARLGRGGGGQAQEAGTRPGGNAAPAGAAARHG